jgi:hypothetical protein
MGASQLYWPDPFATMLAGLATMHEFFQTIQQRKFWPVLMLTDLDKA